ncbi:putative bifunctional diguanylate cyclase/phosphodiesterase [Rhizosaccharibacter radicis]|uniref:EAL domain-containing protein n=1 Tax=Rhizosaccharibacter radicis TaxID=2782605 RepID=A0ABT1W103_9PROT|nr:EAL domain-containing protein [Acetobacteraceae bacterium KSS12]
MTSHPRAGAIAPGARDENKVVPGGTLRGLLSPGRWLSEDQALVAEQATMLFNTSFLFATLGSGSALLFLLAFRDVETSADSVAAVIISLLYAALIASALRWRTDQQHRPFMRRASRLFVLLGIAWGLLVNLFAYEIRPEDQGSLIGLIMGLVSSPMLGVPVSSALSFYVPIALLCSVAVMAVLPSIQITAMICFAGFLLFALVGLLYMNRTILDRATARLALQRQHDTMRVFLREYEEGSSHWVWETDADGRLHDVKPQFGELLGRDPRLLTGMPIDRVLAGAHPAHDDPQDRHAELLRLINSRQAFRDLPISVRRGDTERWLNLTGHPIYDKGDRFAGYRGIGSDVTEARAAQARIEFLAHHDGLTGLLSRQSFAAALERACDDPERRRFALAMLDLDNFKAINDDFSHAVGDRLLEIVSIRMRSILAPHHLSARVGGDEFTFILFDTDAAEAEAAAAEVNRMIRQPVMVESLSITPSSSIGVALFPADGRQGELLMRRADLALHQAKQSEKGSVRLFTPTMEAEYLGRLRLEAELGVAFQRNEIFVVYQPIVDVATGAIVSAEALVRWQHPTRGLLSAGAFVPSAEASDIIDELGEYVLRTTCLQMVASGTRLPVAVNLSPRQLRSGRFVSILQRILSDTGLAPELLALEVTESVFMGTGTHLLDQLAAIRAMGVRVVLDDFGTGYSSLTYLRGFDVDGIKIDASFTRDLPHSRKVAAIIRTIGRLASDMNIYVVAEGVETEEQLHWLRGNGIAFAQGFLLGRPDGRLLDGEARTGTTTRRW